MYGIDDWEPHPPRWEKGSEEVLQNFKNHCLDFTRLPQEDFQSDTKLKEFLNKKIVRFVYDSNRFEDAGVDENRTKEIWENILKDNINTHIPQPNVKEQETINHFLAYKFALENLPQQGISTAQVCQVHKILMQGIDDSAGKLREKTACAGMETQYPDPELVPKFLETVLSSFNIIDKNEKITAFAKASWLKCRFVEVHPFEDGNGRMSRILMNWVLYKEGYLFPVAIASDGHKQAKKHYMQSLRKALSGKNPGNFGYLLLRSVYNSLRDFEGITKNEIICVK